MGKTQRFRTTIFSSGGTTAGIEIPPKIVEALGSGKRPPVRVTLNDYTYRNTVAVMGGKYLIGVSNEHRAKSGLAVGDRVEVTLELDTQPREVPVPADFKRALDRNAKAKTAFATLSPSKKSALVTNIEGAKAAETRQRRIEKAIETLRNG